MHRYWHLRDPKDYFIRLFLFKLYNSIAQKDALLGNNISTSSIQAQKSSKILSIQKEKEIYSNKEIRDMLLSLSQRIF